MAESGLARLLTSYRKITAFLGLHTPASIGGSTRNTLVCAQPKALHIAGLRA